MFTTAKSDLRELCKLIDDVARYDATLAARPEIVPTENSREARNRKQARMLSLMEKYELIGRD
jgi:hypothetical protein